MGLRLNMGIAAILVAAGISTGCTETKEFQNTESKPAIIEVIPLPEDTSSTMKAPKSETINPEYIDMVITSQDFALQLAYMTSAPEMDSDRRNIESEIAGYMFNAHKLAQLIDKKESNQRYNGKLLRKFLDGTAQGYMQPGDVITLARIEEPLGITQIIGMELRRKEKLEQSIINKNGIFYDSETGLDASGVFIPVAGPRVIFQEYKNGHHALDIGSSKVGTYQYDQAWKYDEKGDITVLPGKSGESTRIIGGAYLAAYDGEVVEVGYKSAIGNYMVFKADKLIQGEPLYLIAGHLSAFSLDKSGELVTGPLADVGDKVSQGEILAYTGHSGRSNNHHLHLVCVTGYNPTGKKENLRFSKQDITHYHPLEVLQPIEALDSVLLERFYANPDEVKTYASEVFLSD
jgi:hypothetical protein